jgi:NitT/TauT family transport system substrate-binding protein
MPENHPPAAMIMSRRGLLRGAAGLAAAAILPGTLLRVGRVSAAGETVVNMQLGWIAGNGQLGEIAASELGYFAEEGLALEITPGGPNIDGVASVYSGSAQVGQISSSPSIMLARSEGVPIKCIAAGYQQHPFTYFSLPDNPIREPKDMIGKTIGTNGTARILLSALLAKNNIPEGEVEVVVTGTDMGPLLTGQVDAITGWQTNVSALSILGKDRVDLRLWDTGIQLYANPYYVTDAMLDEHNDQLVGFVRAASRGWGWAYENREAAVDLLIKRYPNLDRAAELQAVGPIMDYTFNAATEAHGWGQMERQKWQDQIDTYAALGQFKAAVPTVDEVMTTAVLDATVEARPRLG